MPGWLFPAPVRCPRPSRAAPADMPTDPDIEIVNPAIPRGRFRSVLFDFDGTLSLIREDWTVPGSHALLEDLCRRGLTLFLASGTDLQFVREEAELLGLTPYFGPHVYGALDEYEKFSKKMVIEQILREHRLRGEELLGF